MTQKGGADMIRHILVGLDGSDYAETALTYGLYLAKQFGATVHGLHVVDIVQVESPLLHDLAGATGAIPFFNLTNKMRENLELWGQQVLAQFRQRCERENVPYVERQVTGVVPTEIVRTAADVDLILLGRGGLHTDLSKALLGSVVETVVRRTVKPTMIIPQQYQQVQKPLVATDGSPMATEALRTAAVFASALKLPLGVVHCALEREEGEQLVAQTKALMAAEHIAGEVDFCLGNPHADLLHYMEDHGHDALFIGAFGHNRVVEWVIGSTTQYLLRACAAPVTLCHAGETHHAQAEAD
jgi:nucleotide-binding universal stress UspA family protein